MTHVPDVKISFVPRTKENIKLVNTRLNLLVEYYGIFQKGLYTRCVFGEPQYLFASHGRLLPWIPYSSRNSCKNCGFLEHLSPLEFPVNFEEAWILLSCFEKCCRGKSCTTMSAIHRKTSNDETHVIDINKQEAREINLKMKLAI